MQGGWFRGTGKVNGTVDRLGVPGPYRVRLLDRATGALVGVTVSSTAGDYTVANAALGRMYQAVAQDDGPDPVQAAAADYLTPEPME